jgi:hypothetical protein
MRLSGRIALLLGVGLLLGLIENRVLWGYFVSRPTLAGEIQQGDKLLAFSMLAFKPGPIILPHSERAALSDDAASFCRPPTNECREGSLVLQLRRLFGDTEITADVGESLLNTAWTELTRTGWLPKASSPAYKDTGLPVAGLAIHLRKPNNYEYLLLAYRTSEIGNDHYAYSEALFRLTESGPTLAKQVHFFLDIAGMEGLEWPILWPANVILLVPFWVVLSVDRLRRRMGKILYWKASKRATPPQSTAPPG